MASFHGEPEMIQYLCAILRRNISPHAYRNPFTMNWSPYVTCTVQWQRFHTAHVKRPLWNSTIDPASPCTNNQHRPRSLGIPTRARADQMVPILNDIWVAGERAVYLASVYLKFINLIEKEGKEGREEGRSLCRFGGLPT